MLPGRPVPHVSLAQVLSAAGPQGVVTQITGAWTTPAQPV